MIPHKAVGCPIRRSEDQRALAPPLGFSQRATSFIASRCQGIHQMPFSCRARAQPQTRAPWSVVSRQWSQTSRRPLPDRTAWSRCANTAPAGAGTHRQHIPMPRPDLTPGASPANDGRTCFTVTTRFTISKGQGTENRGQTSRSVTPVLRHDSRSRCQTTPPGTFLSSDLCLLPSELTHACVVGLGRFERPTSRLSGVRSDQLSYRPKIRDQRTDAR